MLSEFYKPGWFGVLLARSSPAAGMSVNVGFAKNLLENTFFSLSFAQVGPWLFFL